MSQTRNFSPFTLENLEKAKENLFLNYLYILYRLIKDFYFI